MAYHLTYTIAFNNQITENIFVELYRKDVVPGSIIKLKGTFCNKKYINGEGDKFDSILSSELNLGVFIGINDIPDFDDILVSFTDEWKVVLKTDGIVDFVGFLVPNECKAAFRDKPYDIELTATDGLGYLRNFQLTDLNGVNFVGVNFIISYIAAALKKTLLDLNIRIYCNIYESTFPDRNTDHTSDMFNKAKLDYRTFQSSATEFFDIYTCLFKVLTGGFTLFQWGGKWVIMRVGELQQSIGPLIWYTEYDMNGTVIDARLEDFTAAQVAKQQILHPVSANQEILSRLAYKYAKTSYEYTPWDEIPKNNKFERGNLFQTNALPGGTLIEKLSTINDWLYGIMKVTDLSTQPPFGLIPTTDLAYRRSVYDLFGTEQSREVVLSRSGDIAGHRFLRCEGVPVHAGDRIKISVDFKTNQGGSGGRNYMVVMLEPAGALGYRLEQSGGTPTDGEGNLYWKRQTGLRFLGKFYDNGQDPTEYSTFTLEPPSFPMDGMLYVCFMLNDPPVGAKNYFKNFSIEYFPYVAGGLSVVKSDYWKTEQNLNYSDNAEDEVGISDSPIHVLKGALLRSDGLTLTNRTWHRLNVVENRDYKELLNLSRYNAAYRRTWEITGSFGGTMFHPASDETIRLPLGFHKQFFFPNSSKLNGYYFQLVPPLTINYVDGTIDATFVDCMKVDANDHSIDDVQGDTHIFKYVFK